MSAQSVISTTEQLFESFLVDNYIYLDLNELLHWLNVVLKEDISLDDFIVRHTAEELTERLIVKIMQPKKSDREILSAFINNLTEEEITFIYYKNNMINFFKDHPIIKGYMVNILSNVVNLDYVEEKKGKPGYDDNWVNSLPLEYRDKFSDGKKTQKDWNKFVNKKYFMDPNDPPEEIKPYLEKLNEYLMKYVYTRYLSFDKIYRLKNFKRRCVTVIDTDSNILSLDTVINFLIDEVLDGNDYGRDFSKNTYVIVNALTYSITDAVTDILLSYGEHSNIPERFRPKYNMKNELTYTSSFKTSLTAGNPLLSVIFRDNQQPRF